MKRILICGLMLAVVLAMALTADARTKTKWTGPDGQGSLVFYDDSTMITNMACGTGGVTRLVLQSDADLDLASASISDANEVTLELTKTNAASGEIVLNNSKAYTLVNVGDTLGLAMRMKDSANTNRDYATIVFTVDDETSGTEDGSIDIVLEVAGTETTIASFDASGLTVVGAVSPTSVGNATCAGTFSNVTQSAGGTIAIGGDVTVSGTAGFSGNVTNTFLTGSTNVVEYSEGIVTNVTYVL